MSARLSAPCLSSRMLWAACAIALRPGWASAASLPAQLLVDTALEGHETPRADPKRKLVQLGSAQRSILSDDAFSSQIRTKLSQFKVYIYDLPSAFNQDLAECYFDRYGIAAWNDEEKERAQNTADMWLHQLLERYPYRTYNISEASMVYIPFYGFLSTHFSGIHGEPACNDLGHWARARDLATFLQKSETFRERPEIHAMTVSFWAVAYQQYPYWPDEPFAVIAGPLYEQMQKVNLLVYEQQFGSFRNKMEYVSWKSPLVTIPYVPSRQLAEAWVKDTQKRTIFVYFRGNLDLDSASKTGMSRGVRLRQKLIDTFGALPGSLLVDSTTNFSHDAYIQEMKQSKFCIVPRGDTPTSRRLFDTIAAGCIPVILADGIKLPFSDFIDWDAFALQIPEADVTSGGYRVRKAMLDLSDERIRGMQKNLLQARDDFVYGRGNPKYARPGRAPWNALLALRDRMLEDGHL